MSSGSKVVVTGGLGFIGSHFLRRWHTAHPGDELVNLDARTYAADARRVDDVAKSPRYRLVVGDVADLKTVRDVLVDADLVVHFAAESHVDRSIHDASAFVRTNVVGTHALLEAARQADVPRFHHVSTDEVFGHLPLGIRERFHEASPYQPRSPYAASKAAADHLVRAYHATHGLRVTVTHGANHYGPYQHPEKFIPRLLARALQGQDLPVYGTGKNVRDWVHVEDGCAAIETVVERGRIGDSYCVGGDAERTNLEVATAICRLTGRPESLIRFVDDRPGHDLRYASDASKIERELGWKRTRPFERGLQETAAWYRANEAWWRPIQDATEKSYERMGQRVREPVVR